MRLVVILGWKSGSTEVGRLDIFCLLGAGVGIVTLLVLRNPQAALLVAIAVDGVAFLPTIYHGWLKPNEESKLCYICNASASALVIIVAIYSGDGFMGLIYPMYSIVFNSFMSSLLIKGDNPAIYDSSEV